MLDNTTHTSITKLQPLFSLLPGCCQRVGTTWIWCVWRTGMRRTPVPASPRSAVTAGPPHRRWVYTRTVPTSPRSAVTAGPPHKRWAFTCGYMYKFYLHFLSVIKLPQTKFENGVYRSHWFVFIQLYLFLVPTTSICLMLLKWNLTCAIYIKPHSLTIGYTCSSSFQVAQQINYAKNLAEEEKMGVPQLPDIEDQYYVWLRLYWPDPAACPCW